MHLYALALFALIAPAAAQAPLLVATKSGPVRGHPAPLAPTGKCVIPCRGRR